MTVIVGGGRGPGLAWSTIAAARPAKERAIAKKVVYCILSDVCCVCCSNGFKGE